MKRAENYSRPLQVTKLYLIPSLRVSFHQIFCFKIFSIFKSVTIKASLRNISAWITYWDMNASMCFPVPQYYKLEQSDFQLLNIFNSCTLVFLDEVFWGE